MGRVLLAHVCVEWWQSSNSSLRSAFGLSDIVRRYATRARTRGMVRGRCFTAAKNRGRQRRILPLERNLKSLNRTV